MFLNEQNDMNDIVDFGQPKITNFWPNQTYSFYSIKFNKHKTTILSLFLSVFLPYAKCRVYRLGLVDLEVKVKLKTFITGKYPIKMVGISEVNSVARNSLILNPLQWSEQMNIDFYWIKSTGSSFFFFFFFSFSNKASFPQWGLVYKKIIIFILGIHQLLIIVVWGFKKEKKTY